MSARTANSGSTNGISRGCRGRTRRHDSAWLPLSRPNDLWRWQRSSWCESVEDERTGHEYCASCGAEVCLVQVGPRWFSRDPESGLPHRLTCGGAA